MRLLARLVIAAALAAPPVALALSSCGTGAVGVQACRDIEYARCNLAPACDPSFDVTRCMQFYRDECLVGIQNTSSTVDPDTLAPACVAALQAAAACVGGDGGTDGGCEIMLAPDASCPSAVFPSDPSACEIILTCPEVLSACAFLVAPPSANDAGTDASDAASDASTDGGGTGGAGTGGAGTGGASSSSTAASASSTAGTGGAAASSSSIASASSTSGTGGAGTGGSPADAGTD